jgi:hypothetical protein
MRNITLTILIFLSINVISQSLSNVSFKNIYKKPSEKIYIELLSENFKPYKDTSNVFYKYLKNNTDDEIYLFIKDNDKYIYILQSTSTREYMKTLAALDNLLLSTENDYNIFSHKLKNYLAYHIFNDEKQVCLINKY